MGFMSPEIIQTMVPIALLAIAGLVFLAVASRTRQADPDRYNRARRLSVSARDVALGSVGWREQNLSVPDVDCGMAIREVNGKITIARQARLTQDTVASL